MAKGLKIEVSGISAWDLSDEVVYEAVKDCMDDIRDDMKVVTQSLAPHKTGKLERSVYTRRSNVKLVSCSFSIKYTADNKGFDYATWTHNEKYNLGSGSRAKRPVRGRFTKGILRVGTGYMTQVQDASQEGWKNFISGNIDRKLKASLKKNGRSKKTF